MLLVNVGENTIEEFQYGVELTRLADGEAYSLNEYAVSFELIESIFHKSLSLHMILFDGGGFYDKVGVNVNDKIKIHISRNPTASPSDFKSITLDFVISEVGGAALTQNAKAREIHIKAVSEHALVNEITKVGSRMRGTSTQLIRNIGRFYLGVDSIAVPDSTNVSSSVVELLFPNCTPYKAFDLVLDRTIAPNPKKGSMFRIFSTLDGTLMMSNLRQMANTGKLHTYSFVPTKARTNEASDYFRFTVFKQHKHGSYSRRIDAIFQESVAFNHIDRSFVKTKYREAEAPRELGVMGRFSAFNVGNAEEYVLDSVTTTPLFGKSPNVVYAPSAAAFQLGETKTKRIPYDAAQEAAFDSISYTIEILGNPDLRSGDRINVISPALYQDDNQEEVDLFFSGEFLVGNIRHVVEQSKSFTTYVDLFKDRYTVDFGANR